MIHNHDEAGMSSCTAAVPGANDLASGGAHLLLDFIFLDATRLSDTTPDRQKTSHGCASFEG